MKSGWKGTLTALDCAFSDYFFFHFNKIFVCPHYLPDYIIFCSLYYIDTKQSNAIRIVFNIEQ